MEIASFGLVLGLLFLCYLGGTVIFSLILMLIINAVSKIGRIKFLPTFLSTFAAAVVAVIVCTALYTLAALTETDRLTDGYRQKIWYVTVLMPVVHIALIGTVAWISVRLQLRRSRQMVNHPGA